MTHETLTLRDNLTGKEVDYPLIEGTLGNKGLDVRALRKDLGYVTFDPGFVSTASCKSAITFIDGEQGILLHRGYPIEQLAEHCSFLEVAYLLQEGELPTPQELADFKSLMDQHTKLHEALRIFFNGFHYDAHPMAMMVGVVGSLSAFYHSELDTSDAENRKMCAARLLAKIPAIAAACYRHSIGSPYVYPRIDLNYCENFLYMMFSRPERRFMDDGDVIDPVAARALDLLFILHADHEQNASTSTVRLAGSTGANPYACIAAGIAALWGPAHGGANEAVLTMLAEIGRPEKIPDYIAKAKDKNDPFRLMGFGHRVYKNFDPRATLIRKTCHEVLSKYAQADPLFDLAMTLEERALKDDYFIERKLYPNVDFYSGIIYKALGLPTEMFTVLFAIARTAGWVAHWLEMTEDSSNVIGRPRQIYVGEPLRDIKTR